MSNPTPPLHPTLPTDSVGVLLVNSGTPDSLATRDVRRFLGRLLGDPRVVELPRWLWLPILHGIILRTRPARSARKYRKIWTPEGSPLAWHTKELARELQSLVGERYASPIKVATAMLYSTPGVQQAIDQLLEAGARRLLIVPLFPQGSGVTTGAVFDQVAQSLSTRRWLPELRFLQGYHDHPAYIDALRHAVLRQWESEGRTRHLVFAFHGIPQKYFDEGDPYHCFCHKTSRLVAEALKLEPESWTVTFQSRFGPGRWLKPYTDEVLCSLPKRGVKDITLISPGFAADCLETLEELAIEGREQFLAAGGERFVYVPALNSDPLHANMLAEVMRTQLASWADDAPPSSSETKGFANLRFVATA